MIPVMLSNPAIAGGSSLSKADQTAFVHRLAAGDTRAFDRLVAEHQPRLLRLAQRLLGWDADGGAEDVVQSVFLAAFRHVRRFRANSSIGTWLTAITINACRSQRRRQWLRSKSLVRLWRAPRGGDEPPDAPAQRDETAIRVRSAVRQLTEADREVIVLYYLEEMAVAEIANALKASTNAIDVRLHRARARLREKLADMAEGVD